MRELLSMLFILLIVNFASAQTKGRFNGHVEHQEKKDTSAYVKPLPRKRLTSLKYEGIESNVDCKISFTITVDSEGNIVNAQVIRKDTTTDDEAYVKKIMQMVKDQIKYEKINGSEMQKMIYTVNIKAT